MTDLDLLHDEDDDHIRPAFDRKSDELEESEKNYYENLREKRDEEFSEKTYYSALIEARRLSEKEGLRPRLDPKSLEVQYDLNQAIKAACLAMEDTAAIKMIQEELLFRLTTLENNKRSLENDIDRLSSKFSRLSVGITVIFLALIALLLLK